MTSAQQASLAIGFDASRTKAVLRADAGREGEFASLAIRFPGASQSGPLSAEVELDDFLTGIEALADWPEPESVRWDPGLVQLVEEVLEDADRAAARIHQEDGEDAAVHPDDLPGLLGADWDADLTSFQQRDIARLLSLRHGANFSVPGAGKTRVALAVYAALRAQGDVRRLLVVAPKSAFDSWRFEAATCFTSPLRTGFMDKRMPGGCEVLVVNYERLDRGLDGLAGWLRAAPAMLILDEAHRMKLGARGVYGSACLALGPLSRRRLILTGTPAPNGARDLENLLSFVWPGHGRRVVVNAVAGGDLGRASEVLRPLFTRTTKAELGLPPFQPVIRPVTMPPLHREIYDALVGRYTARAEASRSDLDALGRALLRLLMAATSPALLVEGSSRYEPLGYQVPPLVPPAGGSLIRLLENLPKYEIPPKYEEVMRIVRDNAAKNRKTLVWSTFVRNLTTLENILAPFRPAMVFGGTTDRDEELRRFRNDPDCFVLLSNPATLGEGISLHWECHDAVYVDRDFIAGRYLQSLDRIHRLGLEPGTETNVTILAARETVDEVVAKRLTEKLEFMGRILDDPSIRQLGDLEEEGPVVGGMDGQDIDALLGHLGKAARRSGRRNVEPLS
ncbi:DEAD/DEAH box helicase [Actinomadura sp. NPDC048955]|uniref:DEAD/DEAH box helicase n=1 Tax=Actinomadura sp. NPDC048955 TaxID=3158228 RepID=UPI00340450A0